MIFDAYLDFYSHFPGDLALNRWEFVLIAFLQKADNVNTIQFSNILEILSTYFVQQINHQYLLFFLD